VNYHLKFPILINAAGVADPGSVHFSTIFHAFFDFFCALFDAARFSS
jgi:hypothetical protein